MKKNKILLALLLSANLCALSMNTSSASAAGTVADFVKDSTLMYAGSGGLNAPKALALLQLVNKFEITGDNLYFEPLTQLIKTQLPNAVTNFLLDSGMKNAGAGGIDSQKAVSLLSLAKQFEITGDNQYSTPLIRTIQTELNKEVADFVACCEQKYANAGGVDVNRAVALLELAKQVEVAGNNELSNRIKTSIALHLEKELGEFTRDSRLMRAGVGGLDSQKALNFLKLVKEFETAGNNKLSNNLNKVIQENLSQEVNDFVSFYSQGSTVGINPEKANALLDLVKIFSVPGDNTLLNALSGLLSRKL